MTSLTRFETEDGIELVIDTVTGESFATVSGYARMSGKDKSTISRRLQGVDPTELKDAEIQTAGGLQGVVLLPGKLVRKWLLKDNPELLEAMSDAGWNVYCHLKAGYKVSSTVIAATSPTIPTPALSAVSPEERLKMAVDSLAILGLDFENPRFKQGYQDWAHQTLGIGVTPALPGTVEERWRGGAERAEELGFGRVGADASLRVRLGNFLTRQTWDVEDRRREERICNGQNREIWIYRICERFDDCIRAFFQMKAK